MKTTLHATKNNLHGYERENMMTLLNRNLADGLDLAPQAKQAHWRGRGIDWFVDHRETQA